MTAVLITTWTGWLKVSPPAPAPQAHFGFLWSVVRDSREAKSMSLGLDCLGPNLPLPLTSCEIAGQRFGLCGPQFPHPWRVVITVPISLQCDDQTGSQVSRLGSCQARGGSHESACRSSDLEGRTDPMASAHFTKRSGPRMEEGSRGRILIRTRGDFAKQRPWYWGRFCAGPLWPREGLPHPHPSLGARFWAPP